MATDVVIRLRRRRKLGRRLLICACVVETGCACVPGEHIDIVASGEDHARALLKGERHLLRKVEFEPTRSRAALRVARVIEYGFAIDDGVHASTLHSPKHHRATVLAQWLVARLGEAALQHVIDVGGGRGEVAAAIHGLVPSASITIVEPCDRTDEVRTTCSTRLRVHFDYPISNAEVQKAVASATAIVALHADEATEAAVCAAAHRGLAFAVVPCCVFPTVFKSRRQFWRFDPEDRKRAVRTYTTFVLYLVERARALGAHDCRTAELPLEGKNIVVYSLGRTPQHHQCTTLHLDSDSLHRILGYLDVVVDLALSTLTAFVSRQWNYEATRFIRARIDTLIDAAKEIVDSTPAPAACCYTVRLLSHMQLNHLPVAATCLDRFATHRELATALAAQPDRLPLSSALGARAASRLARIFAAIHVATRGPAFLGRAFEAHPHDQAQISVLFAERAGLLLVLSQPVV